MKEAEEINEVEEVKEGEDRRNRPRKNGQARLYSLFPLLPSLPLPPFVLSRCVYLLGAVVPPPDGFLTSLSYVCNSLDAQNHSAISHFGSSLWSLGGLTQAFV